MNKNKINVLKISQGSDEIGNERQNTKQCQKGQHGQYPRNEKCNLYSY